MVKLKGSGVADQELELTCDIHMLLEVSSSDARGLGHTRGAYQRLPVQDLIHTGANQKPGEVTSSSVCRPPSKLVRTGVKVGMSILEHLRRSSKRPACPMAACCPQEGSAKLDDLGCRAALPVSAQQMAAGGCPALLTGLRWHGCHG